MTIISHRHRFIFLKSRKTAGTSIERALLPVLAAGDQVAISTENEPLNIRAFDTPNRTRPGFFAEKTIKRLLRRTGHSAMKLREHMPANAVKRHVGEGIWRDYLTVTVERDPWRRLVSLWRWRCRHHRLKVDFESFLEAIESGSRQRELAVGARRWSNRPFYEIDGQRAVDQVLQFDTIGADFRRFCDQLDLPVKGPLPRAKVIHSSGAEPAQALTADQIERIGRLCQREIEYFGYRPPTGITN